MKPVPSQADAVATRGDAEAVLRALGNGGWAALLKSGKTVAAPADDPFAARVQIRPFDIFGGRHYCGLDWHAIVFADIEGGDRSFGRADAEAVISQFRVELELDGVSLSLVQTPVEAFLNPGMFGLEAAYYSQWGTTRPPEELAAGEHSLRGRLSDATGALLFDNTITFVVDAPGTGACP